jgi:hypothetical protein
MELGSLAENILEALWCDRPDHFLQIDFPLLWTNNLEKKNIGLQPFAYLDSKLLQRTRTEKAQARLHAICQHTRDVVDLDRLR